jgi:hypothetical protein
MGARRPSAVAAALMQQRIVAQQTWGLGLQTRMHPSDAMHELYRCLAAHGADALAACFLAENTLPHVTSPIFATQDLVDSWQMGNIYQEPCIANLSACTPAQVGEMNRYRTDMLALLAPLTGSASNGAYLSSCVQHCHQNIDSVWTQELVQAQTVQQTFLRWWTGGGPGVPLVIDGLYGTNKHCYGVPYGGGCAR